MTEPWSVWARTWVTEDQVPSNFLSFLRNLLTQKATHDFHSDSFPGAVTVSLLLQVDMDTLEVPLQVQCEVVLPRAESSSPITCPRQASRWSSCWWSPVRSCSRRVVSQAAEERFVWKRLKLCWSISWSTEMAWASWSWPPSTIFSYWTFLGDLEKPQLYEYLSLLWLWSDSSPRSNKGGVKSIIYGCVAINHSGTHDLMSPT